MVGYTGNPSDSLRLVCVRGIACMHILVSNARGIADFGCGET